MQETLRTFEGTLLDGVGNTPLLPLRSLTRGGVEVYAKAEWHNPSGSVKDRPAARILRASLPLLSGRSLLDSTSGNMGIAYATLGASLGVPIHLVVPANASPVRLSILKALGAELTLSDPIEGSDGARTVAARLASEQPDSYLYADQYSHPANWTAHYETTGPEIAGQSAGRITHFVAGVGTTGTLVGTGRYLREHVPSVRVIGFQPDGPLHGLEGMKHLPTSDVPEIFDPTVADDMLEIQTEAAYRRARALAREEGLLVGVSSGAAAEAAVRLARRLDSGVIVTVFPDSGLKYLDEPFWEESDADTV